MFYVTFLCPGIFLIGLNSKCAEAGMCVCLCSCIRHVCANENISKKPLPEHPAEHPQYSL